MINNRNILTRTIADKTVSALLRNIEEVGFAIKSLDVNNKNCRYHFSLLDNSKVISSCAYRDLKALSTDNNMWKDKGTVVDRVEKAQKLLCIMLRVYYNLQEEYNKRMDKQEAKEARDKAKADKAQEQPQEIINYGMADVDKPPLCGIFE